jgi:hypothetical protein
MSRTTGATLLDVLQIAEHLIDRRWAWTKGGLDNVHARDQHDKPCDPQDRRAERFTLVGALAAAAPDEKTYLAAYRAVWAHAHPGMLLASWQDAVGYERSLDALRKAIVDVRLELLATPKRPAPPPAPSSETDP